MSASSVDAPLVRRFFGGFQLWPSARTDVPNLTLYFGSGSPANPDELFMRLECVPRRDVAVDAAYAEAYYAPFTSTCLELMTGDDRFRPYVSDSPYARGCLAPSGVRVFFDGADRCRRVGAYVATDL